MSIEDGVIPLEKLPPHFIETDEGINPVQPIIDFVNQVDTVYRGLGIPTLYGVLSVMANKSVMFIGSRGTGKTRLIKLIPDIPGTIVEKWDTFTYGELSAFCKRHSDSKGVVRGKHLVFKVEEFSTFQKYHKKQFLTTASKTVTDGNYRHIIKSTHIDIEDCQLTMLIAIQPRIYSDLCTKYTAWDALSYDRFTKFLLINPLRIGTSRDPCDPTLPRKITHIETVDIDTFDLSILKELFGHHISAGRAEIYALDYVKALAEFLGAATVEQWHIELFYNLFHPYLNSFSVLQSAEDLEAPVTVKTSYLKLITEIGKSLDYVSKKSLSERLYVGERHIERTAKDLLEKGLIDKPSSHAAMYRLSQELKEFFEKYADGSLFRIMSDNQKLATQGSDKGSPE